MTGPRFGRRRRRGDGLDGEAARGMVRLLADPTVGPYTAAKLLASIGIWIHNVTAAVVVFDVTGSAVAVAAVSIAQFTPQVVLAPWAGARADRAGRRRRQVVMGRLAATLGSGGLAVWLAVTGMSALHGPAPIIGAALIVGIGFAISIPAMQALVPALARPEELASLVTIDTAPFTLARAVGPALGALILATAGPAAAFGVAAAGQLLLAFVMARIRLRPVDQPASGDKSVSAGLRHLRADPPLALLLVGVIGIGVGVDPVITLTPPLAADLGHGAPLVAFMASSFGLGAATAPLLLGPMRRRIRETIIGPSGLAVLALAMAALAASTTAFFALAALYVAGIGMILGITSFTTQIHQRLPEGMRGRIMGLWTVCFVGTRPLAAAVNGTLADLLSAQAALLILAIVLVVIAFVTRPRRS